MPSPRSRRYSGGGRSAPRRALRRVSKRVKERVRRALEPSVFRERLLPYDVLLDPLHLTATPLGDLDGPSATVWADIRTGLGYLKKLALRDRVRAVRMLAPDLELSRSLQGAVHVRHEDVVFANNRAAFAEVQRTFGLPPAFAQESTYLASTPARRGAPAPSDHFATLPLLPDDVDKLEEMLRLSGR